MRIRERALPRRFQLRCWWPWRGEGGKGLSRQRAIRLEGSCLRKGWLLRYSILAPVIPGCRRNEANTTALGICEARVAVAGTRVESAVREQRLRAPGSWWSGGNA